MKLPRHAELWLPGYLKSRFSRRLGPANGQARVWLSIADHYEPLGGGADEETAIKRVAFWEREWTAIAARHQDSAGRPAKYTFFYPQEEYRPQLLDPLARMTHAGIGDVEVHIHHDREGEQNFVDRMSGFQETLVRSHGLLHQEQGKIRFGFIHGNWALDNSLPGGKWCGLNNELTLLQQLGCYADFTMPSGASPSQSHMVNTIYWATDDPARPKSYDYGVPLTPGASSDGLLMIPGPFGVRWKERLIPRLEKGEIASYDLPNRYRLRCWFSLAPRLGGDIFIKLFTHGCQDRHSKALLAQGGLDPLFQAMEAECGARKWPFYYVSCWEMYQAIEAIREGRDPVAAATSQQRAVNVEK